MNHLIELPNGSNKPVEIIQLIYLSEMIKLIHPGDMNYKSKKALLCCIQKYIHVHTTYDTRQDKVKSYDTLLNLHMYLNNERCYYTSFVNPLLSEYVVYIILLCDSCDCRGHFINLGPSVDIPTRPYRKKPQRNFMASRTFEVIRYDERNTLDMEVITYVRIFEYSIVEPIPSFQGLHSHLNRIQDCQMRAFCMHVMHAKDPKSPATGQDLYHVVHVVYNHAFKLTAIIRKSYFSNPYFSPKAPKIHSIYILY
jgi:hypothetical protein